MRSADAARLGLAVATAWAVLAAAPAAHAYCRTTSCDAVDSTADCLPDTQGCSTVGEALFWKQRCISYNVQIDGSDRRGFTWEELDGLVSTGFRQWQSADCGGGTPSIEIINLNEIEGPAECDEPEYNKQGANANVWMFRDVDWRYSGAGSTLALTTVSFLTRTGQIVDADVEINTFAISNFTTTDLPGAVRTDLQSVVTHEAGHFLGLAHSSLQEATMHDYYDGGSTEMRSLDRDDVAGICEIYPPDRDVADCSTAEPFGGFAAACNQPATSTTSPLTDPEGPANTTSCQCGVPRSTSDDAPLLAALAAVGLLVSRGRRQKRR